MQSQSALPLGTGASAISIQVLAVISITLDRSPRLWCRQTFENVKNTCTVRLKLKEQIGRDVEMKRLQEKLNSDGSCSEQKV